MHHDFFQILFRFSLCCCDVGDGVCDDVCVVFTWQLAHQADLLLLHFQDLFNPSQVSANAMALESQWREAQPPLDIALPQTRRYNHHYNRHRYCNYRNRHSLICYVDGDVL